MACTLYMHILLGREGGGCGHDLNQSREPRESAGLGDSAGNDTQENLAGAGLGGNRLSDKNKKHSDDESKHKMELGDVEKDNRHPESHGEPGRYQLQYILIEFIKMSHVVHVIIANAVVILPIYWQCIKMG